MIESIFVAYRRMDSAGWAGKLYDKIVRDFGRQQVFRDVASLTAGRDFVLQVEHTIAKSRLMVVIIGPRWLAAADEMGNRRLEDPQDLHRVEIATALDRNIPVIPVLVDGAAMPRPTDLPAEIRDLSRRQALRVDDDRWEHDAERVTGVIRDHFLREAPG